MMVNTHFKIQQTEATSGLEELQAAPRHRPGCGPGRPSTAKSRRCGKSRGSGCERRGPTTAPPSDLKEERRSSSQGRGDKGPARGSAAEARRRRGDRRQRTPTEPSGHRPRPPPWGTTSHTQPALPHLWPLPASLRPSVWIPGPHTPSCLHLLGPRTHPWPQVPRFRREENSLCSSGL